jgi:SAM-dependent methyltransferase
MTVPVPVVDSGAEAPEVVVVTGMRRKLLSAIAGQLGRPHGRLNRIVAVALNRGNRPAVAAAVRASAAAPGDVVADIGFGGGIGLSMLLDRVGAGGVVHGIEISREMLDRARARNIRHRAAGQLRLSEGSITVLPLPDHCLDAAITVNTIYFVADLDEACSELARVLRPGGRLVVGIGDPEAMARLPFTGYGFILRPVDDVIAALRTAGFDLTDHQHLDDIAIPHHLLVVTRSAEGPA